MQNIILYLFFISIVTVQANAQKRKGVWGVQLGVAAGELGNTTDVLSRSMAYTPVGFYGGFLHKQFKLSFELDYILVAQTAPVINLNNQNISGTEISGGVRIDYFKNKNHFGLIYRPFDRLTLDMKTNQGTESVYSGNSIELIYSRQIKNKFGLFINIRQGHLKSDFGYSDDFDLIQYGAGLILFNY